MVNEPLERQAIRILFILRYCGTNKGQPSLFGPRYAIESEKKLQKIQFWVRNPDYLADALLGIYKSSAAGARRSSEIKETVFKIFQDREPIIRRVAMQRFLYGAYEPLDRVLAFLISKGLMSGRRQENIHRSVYFFLTEEGAVLIDKMVQECPETHWYVERCQLIHSFWGDLSGNVIGEIQHSNPAYHNTKIADVVRPIIPQVREKYKDLFGEDLPYDET